MERQIDVLGRVVVPSEIRSSLGIRKGDIIKIEETTTGKIILTPNRTVCGLCGSPEDLHEIGFGKPICENCAEMVRRTTTTEAIAERQALLEKLGRA